MKRIFFLLNFTFIAHYALSQSDSLDLANDDLANVICKKAGAKVFRGSPYDTASGLKPENLIDDSQGENAVWRAKIKRGNFDSVYVTIELPDYQSITSLVFNTKGCNEDSFPGISPKVIQVEYSDDSLFNNTQRVLLAALRPRKNHQVFTVSHAKVKWLRIKVLSNHGNKNFVELGRIYAYNDSGFSEIEQQLYSEGKVDEPIEFKENSFAIEPESIPLIEQIARLVMEQPSWKMVVEGHTDNVGNPVDNKKLSEERAKAVVDVMVKAGVAPSRLTAVGYGHLRPKCSNETEEGRQCNRRVTFVLKTVDPQSSDNK